MDLKKLYSIIKENLIFTEKEVCANCQRLCSREQRWHWLLPEEAERLKDKIQVEDKFGASFFLDGRCPLLKNTRCSIYEDRPLECRLSPLFLYQTNNKLFWIIDIGCPYFRKYKDDKVFWGRVNKFISEIEPYFKKDIVKELIKISEAIKKFDPLIEDKDFIKIKEFKSK